MTRHSTGGRPRWIKPTITGLVVAILVGAVGFWWVDDHRTGVHFSGEFTSSIGVYPGSGVRILGVPVGEVDSVTPDGPLVRISMHLDPGVSAAADTKAAIVSPNLVSDRYVQLTGVYTHGPKLANGAVIPASSTATPVEIDQLYGSLLALTKALGPNGANKTGALSDLLNSSAANLSGNGGDIKKTITSLSSAVKTLDGSSTDIFGTVSNLSKFTSMLSQNNSALSTLTTELASVSGVLATDRQSFGAALHDLGSALALVQTFIKTNRTALKDNVDKLSEIAATLASEKTSLAQALQTAPLLTQNFKNAYDPSKNLLLGRGDLNELTIWAQSGTTSSSAATSSSTAVPMLLPGLSSGGAR
jgi:phospholipid/cholesterol/gamma-HCH transport system substrate-binding protein